MTAVKALTVACPTCKIAVIWRAESTFKPFCSERCRLIDLGDWATESHKIPVQPSLSDQEPSFFDETSDPETW